MQSDIGLRYVKYSKIAVYNMDDELIWTGFKQTKFVQNAIAWAKRYNLMSKCFVDIKDKFGLLQFYCIPYAHRKVYLYL